MSGVNSKLSLSVGKRGFVPVALAVTLLFLTLSLLAIRNQVYVVWLIAPALIMGLIALGSIDRFFLILLFLTPLSVQLRFLNPDTAIDIFLPTELMLVAILFIVLFKLFNSREFDRRLLKHPITKVALISLIWMLITVATSSSLIVSLKAFFVRFWYIAAFYLLASELFKIKNFQDRALKALVFGMVPVVIYNLFRQVKFGLFDQQVAHSTMWPFFNDHTSYGAALAFLIPVVIYLLIRSRNIFSRLFYSLISILFVAGFVFSYSRAAWISLILSAIFAFIYLFKIPWKLVWTFVLLSGLILASTWSNLKIKLESNNQSSSGNLTEHVQSISNITTDASNMERLNRWKSAVRMIKERPILGWGPGTYQFNYAPYQFSNERTIISTNFGDAGNAHSEYLGSMVDSGIPATALYVLLLVLVFMKGDKVWRRSKGSRESALILALMTGLMTYVIHGGLNNFLDTDKISAPFWIYIALITIMDMGKKEPVVSQKLRQ